MHRFHVPPGQCSDAEIVLTEREAHHGINVLRVRRGEPVTALDGEGAECRCEVVDLARHTIRLKVLEKRRVPPLPYQVTLIQALPKGKLFDTIVQKATELGVARIVPLISERVISLFDADRSESKFEHWRQTAVEAIKQCGSAWLPKVEAPVTLKEFVNRNPGSELALVGSLQPGSQHPRKWFREFFSAHGRLPTSVAIWVGPEGDFTAAEVEAIQSTGVRPITLGRLVLRCDTAAVYCLSVLNHELQDAVS